MIEGSATRWRFGLAAASVILCLAVTSNGANGQSAQGYYGLPIGKLSQLHHGVSGDVYAVDARTLHIRDFTYDGEGPAAYFYAGNSKNPSRTGFKIRDERGSDGVLKRYRRKHITLTLPEGKTLHNIRWFSVYCDEFEVNFGDVRFNKNADYPKPQKINALNGIHGVSSDQIVVVDAQTLLVPGFSYDGEAPDAKFWVGRGPKPSSQGIRVADENGKFEPLRRYDQKTLVLTLPGDLTVFDIGHFGVWCEAFAVDFAHVELPRNLGVPPSLKMLGVQPQKYSQSPAQSFLGHSQQLIGSRADKLNDDPYIQNNRQSTTSLQSYLSLFNDAQHTVRATTYRPHAHRQQPTTQRPLNYEPVQYKTDSTNQEPSIQVVPSILLNPTGTLENGGQYNLPQQQPQFIPPYNQPRHKLQELHEQSVKEHQNRLRQQEIALQNQATVQQRSGKAVANFQAETVQIPFNLPQYHPQNINFHLQQLASQQTRSKADFDERQLQHPLQQQHNLQVQRLQQQQQQQQQQQLNIPLSQPTLQEFQQRQQFRQQDQQQQQQRFDNPIFIPPQQPQQQNVNPLLLFKSHANDLYAINNLADRSIEGNAFQGNRNVAFVDPQQQQHQQRHLAPGPNPAFFQRNDAPHPQQSRSFSHLVINSSQGRSDTFVRYN